MPAGWLAFALQLFQLAGLELLQNTLWMMLQMQLGRGGHAKCPDLSPSYSSLARRLVHTGRKALLTRKGALVTTRGACCIWHLGPALQQQEFLLNEVCSVVK